MTGSCAVVTKHRNWTTGAYRNNDIKCCECLCGIVWEIRKALRVRQITAAIEP